MRVEEGWQADMAKFKIRNPEIARRRLADAFAEQKQRSASGAILRLAIWLYGKDYAALRISLLA
jgi:hypothetical protein